MPRRISRQEEERIEEAYLAWDPQEMSITELAEHLGYSKGLIYNVLNRRGVSRKGLVQAQALDQAAIETFGRLAWEDYLRLQGEVATLRAELQRLRSRKNPKTAIMDGAVTEAFR